MSDKERELRDLLEQAYNGLKWYRDMHPEDDSGADDELYAHIDAALDATPAEPSAVELTDEGISAALHEWFNVPGTFEDRMRRAVLAAAKGKA